MAKTKFYAVASGKVPGIYTSWPDTQAQVMGVQGAKYKSFSTRQEAEAWMGNPVYETKAKKAKAAVKALEPLAEGTIGVYSDGGALGNPGVGAYGVVIVDGAGRRELKSGFSHTTNNRMELMGCIMGLRDVQTRGLSQPVVVTTDSSYVVQGIEKGWAKNWRRRGWLKADGNPAMNADLWAQLLEIIEALTQKVLFRWVKGHAGHPENERCDALVNEITRGGGVLPEDKGYAKP